MAETEIEKWQNVRACAGVRSVPVKSTGTGLTFAACAQNRRQDARLPDGQAGATKARYELNV
jgi:hypothetical protein